MTSVQLFLAVLPPDDILQAIDDLPTRAQRGVKYTRKPQWHLTLQYLGAADPQDALDALETLAASATEVTLGPEVALLGQRVVMVPAQGLEPLVVAVADTFQGIGEPQPERPFHGHLTVARLKGAPLKNPSTVSFLGAPISVSFPATEVTLIQTELTDEGTVHTVLGEKQLEISNG